MTTIDPSVIRESACGSTAEVVFVVPEDLAYFDGHFPGVPIVPGVVQIKWAIEIARRCLSLTSAFAGMEVVKFHQIMGAGMEVTLVLEYSPETGKLSFSFESGHRRLSSGRVVLSRRTS
ncbi:MAG TPA: hypothetical protein VE907_22360 [Gammaproteobacteria bacterium]|nr:hypothetical protein [Gammaproteobacteria bacterium]